MANFEALTVAIARSAEARKQLARNVFFCGGAVFLATLAWHGYSRIPVEFWSLLSGKLSAAHTAYTRFYFAYLWSPVVWGLYLMAGVWLLRDYAIVRELRVYHLEHPEADRAVTSRWLEARQVRTVLVAGVVIAAGVTACMGPNNELPLVLGTALLLLSIHLAEHVYSELPVDAKSNAPAADRRGPLTVAERRAYEKGYLYGRFHDAGPSATATAEYSEPGAMDCFLEGVKSGHAMRASLRAKGVDVNYRL